VKKLALTLACWEYDRTRALFDGKVKAEGIELNCISLMPNETFYRMLRHKEFHASELSLGSYSTLKARGDCPFIAIPVFPSRFFRHSCIYINSEAGIHSPEDLKGKRVGVPEYQLTAAIFVRGMLQHEYGVKAEDVKWFWGGQEESGRVGAISYQLPERIHLQEIPAERTLVAMLETGELDALITPNMPSSFMRLPKVKRLFRITSRSRWTIFSVHVFFRSCTRSLFEEMSMTNIPGWLRAERRSRKPRQSRKGMYMTEALRLTLPG
jgi:4,5-dihydroxyphthalate decarboxylase